ncbi:unnamed protein product, partial [marine sediment metagenome]
ADLKHYLIEIHKFDKVEEIIKVKREMGGHGGGDTGLMSQFIRILRGKLEKDGMTMVEASLESHIMAFAAEIAREKGIVVNLDKLRREASFEKKKNYS